MGWPLMGWSLIDLSQFINRTHKYCRLKNKRPKKTTTTYTSTNNELNCFHHSFKFDIKETRNYISNEISFKWKEKHLNSKQMVHWVFWRNSIKLQLLWNHEMGHSEYSGKMVANTRSKAKISKYNWPTQYLQILF